jgi:hypothetical protein
VGTGASPVQAESKLGDKNFETTDFLRVLQHSNSACDLLNCGIRIALVFRNVGC